MDDQQWRDTNEPVLRRVLDPTAYPFAVRIGAAAGAAHGSPWNSDRAWTFGIGLTLDGVANLIDTAS